jgi:dTDP-glucose 4,6-dehydratase
MLERPHNKEKSCRFLFCFKKGEIDLNILVTGGCGFQGSHLVETLLKDGHYVRILNTPSLAAKVNYSRYLEDKKNLNVVWGSVVDNYLVDICMKDIEVVFHLGAKVNVDESFQAPLDFFNINIKGTDNVCASAAERRIKLIFGSSCECYGSNMYGDVNILESVKKYNAKLNFISTAAVYGIGSMFKMNEWHPLMPASPYAATKASADRLCYSYYKTYGLDVKIVRPFNIFGPRQKRSGFGAVIPIFFEKALLDDKLVIYGDGKQTRDYLYVTDIVNAYKLIMETKEFTGKAVNVGSGTEISINQIAEKICELLNVPRKRIQHIHDRPGEVNSFIADTTFIEQYGFKPTVSFDDGLKKYLDWRLKL